jgi:hypothetical protein
MTPPPSGSAWERLIAPRALFAGIAVAFVSCCVAGHVVSNRNLHHHLERFFVLLSPLDLYYPTTSEVCALAHQRLDPAKYSVVVGGSSILQGGNQNLSALWTRRLQQRLGDQYQVLNLALFGVRGNEFGGIAAEGLCRDYERLVFVADIPVGHWWQADPDGNVYKYFFWDAYYKGRLLPNQERDRRLQEERDEMEPASTSTKTGAAAPLQPKSVRQGEIQREMAADNLLYFNELWNVVTMRYVSTVWTPGMRCDFPRPRARVPESDTPPPPDEHDYPPEVNATYLDYLRGTMNGRCVRDAQGHWVENKACPGWAKLEREACTCFPEELRRRTVLLVMWASPYYLRQLTEDEQACYAAVSRLTVQHLEAVGFLSVEAGPGFALEDYRDFVHLGPTGGARLADTIAPRIRDMSQRQDSAKP